MIDGAVRLTFDRVRAGRQEWSCVSAAASLYSNPSHRTTHERAGAAALYARVGMQFAYSGLVSNDLWRRASMTSGCALALKTHLEETTQPRPHLYNRVYGSSAFCLNYAPKSSKRHDQTMVIV
jgi:hypothetical protein